ncbi:MAG: bacterial transcriptional activator domain-containing protein, partial [Gemmatimonadota bacterium]
VDVEEFLTEAAAGLALLREGREAEAGSVLESAEARYTGDFLEEDAYEEWATALREEARTTYIAVARALARLAVGFGNPEASSGLHLRILERDPYDEEAHLGLVAVLLAVGRHGEARRFYRTYVARMEELDVEPAPMPAPAEIASSTGDPAFALANLARTGS